MIMKRCCTLLKGQRPGRSTEHMHKGHRGRAVVFMAAKYFAYVYRILGVKKYILFKVTPAIFKCSLMHQ